MRMEEGYYESLTVAYDVEWADGRGEIKLGAVWVSFDTVKIGDKKHEIYSKSGDKLTEISKFRLSEHFKELKQLVKDVPEAKEE